MLAQIKEYLFLIAQAVLEFLPDSPFTAFYSRMGSVPFLGYINYFVPIDTMIAIGEAWLVCIGIFYAYQVIMRFSGMID